MPPPRKRARVSEPTVTPPLPSSHIIAPSPLLSKILLKLSKPSLILLVSKWIEDHEQTKPDLSPTEDDLYDDDEAPDALLDDVMDAYNALKTRKAIAERVFEREWRDGLSLLQIAQAEVQQLYDQPSSFKWTAAELTIQGRHAAKTSVPRLQPKAFAQSLQSLIHSMAQCHYHITRHPSLPLTLIRLSLFPPHPPPTKPSSAVAYYAFPDASAHVFFVANPKPLVQIAHKSIPAALSSQHSRFELTSAGLTARTLETLVSMKGNARGAMGAQGAWSVYKVEGEDAVDANPLDVAEGRRKRARDSDHIEKEGRRLDEDEEDDDTRKKEEKEERGKRQKVAEGRFGISGREADGAGLERAEFYLRELYPKATNGNNARGRSRGRSNNAEDEEDGEDENERWRPAVTVTLEGSHVFAGVRSLIEEGIIDGVKMPNWMTGEEGRSVASIRDGKLFKRDIDLVH